MPTKHAVVRQISGLTFAAKSDSNHWVTMDGPVELGGSNAGTRPKESSAPGPRRLHGKRCRLDFEKESVLLDGFEIRLSAEAREEHPQIFTSIHIEYLLTGDNIPKADVERAIDLSTTKYCPVSAMLSGTVQITHSYKINPEPATLEHV